MTDIIFYCSQCQTRLIVDEEGVGMEVPCPVCATELVVPEESQENLPETEDLTRSTEEIDAGRIDAKAREICHKMAGAPSGGAVPVIREEDKGLDISFACPHCETRLVVDSAGAGLDIPCPHCSEELTIPDPLELPENFPVAPLVEKVLALQKSHTGKRFTQFQASPESLPLKPRRVTIKAPTKSAQMLTESGLPLAKETAPGKGDNGSVGLPMSAQAALSSSPKAVSKKGPSRKSPPPRSRGPLRFEPKEKSDLTLRLQVAPTSPDEARERRERLRRKAARARETDLVPKQLAEPQNSSKNKSPADKTKNAHTGPLPPSELNETDFEEEPLESYPQFERAFARPKKKHRRLRNITLVLLPFILIWLGFMAYVFSIFQNSPGDVNLNDPLTTPPATAGDDYYVIDLDVLEKRTLGSIIQQFSQAETWQEAAQFVRDPERIRPLMEEYYADNPWEPLPIDNIEIRRAGWMGGKLLVLTTVVTSDTYKEYYFIAERKEGSYRIDWETLVEYNRMSWAEFKRTMPKEPVTMRANLTPGSYYNFQFSDPEEWVCFEIRSRDEGFLGLYGYVKRNSDLHQELQELLTQSSPIAVMINIKYPENATSPDLVEITEFLRSGWIVL